ncbi:UDP-N-acetylglucosamine transferase subunit ALG13 [Rhodotorula toruloides ATCC 204091]|uniref:UDP-N-acetylglucosamine transferase subunit ALG13 n=1 Tax=Rhodotorula toruloides TaxID=5286 RepID=A0A0K3CC72_RHOTO|nr:UDP-N-acetylglucosamine transferase subunit ALG13 [Rhodotorula toruloides ATCC 204091]PRQ76326.1 UDP-N-acetylglucosamine transferase subunit ALG13 [Rhodotorula toruloides]
MPSTCVLTVGSTRFDPLVASFLDPTSLSSLSSLGIQHVLAQVGNSSLPEGWKEGTRMTEQGLQVEVVRFLGDLEERVGRADLVVSHAGAGSILSFLRPLNSSSPSSSAERTRRQLVLIPNSTLMDSHQSDLADEMEKKGWAVVCRRPEDLPATLKQLASRAEQQGEMPAPDYPELYKGRMQRIIDETLGYV